MFRLLSQDNLVSILGFRVESRDRTVRTHRLEEYLGLSRLLLLLLGGDICASIYDQPTYLGRVVIAYKANDYDALVRDVHLVNFLPAVVYLSHISTSV